MNTQTSHPMCFCSGLKRSGSTWSYNVCRLLMQKAYGNIYAGYIGEGDALNRFMQQVMIDRPVLLKFHYPSDLAFEMVKNEHAKNIYTWRNPLDSIASEMDFFEYDFDTALTNIHAGLQMMDRWKKIDGTIFISFDDLTRDPAAQIRKIAAHLMLEMSEHDITNINEATSIESSRKHSSEIKDWEGDKVIQHGKLKFDPVTLLHADGHASKGRSRKWQDTLSTEQESVVRERLAAWMQDW